MPTATISPSSPSRASVAPLWAVLAITLIGSLGTGAVTNGVFFLAKSGLNFDTAQNAQLGILLGLTYIAGALAIGPALLRLARHASAISTRAVLVALHAVLALLATTPWLINATTSSLPGWALVVPIAIYMPATGALWPIVESHLAGGRRGVPLRRAIGRFNIIWSSAVAASYWLMAPLVESAPLTVLAGLGALHLATIPLLFALPREPRKHVDDEHEPHPPVYARLLAAVRILLPTSYLLSSTINVVLPTAVNRLAVPTEWQTPVASTYLVVRVLVFAGMERWHGWHGRWWPVVVAAAFMLVGTALTVLSPAIAPTPSAGVALLMVGLATFGIGMSATYCAALYYAMEVGAAEVNAGGTHEALIGIGYTLGPAGILAVSMAADRGLIDPGSSDAALALLVGVMALAAVAVAIGRGKARKV